MKPGLKVGAGRTVTFFAALVFWSATALAQHDLDPGEARDIVPRYLLQDVNGRAVTTEDHQGYFQLLSFGYTFCPDICPTTLTEMAAVLKALGPLAQHLRPIFISLDPERDTLKVLREYTAFFDPRIIGMTGSPALVARAAGNFKVRYQKVHEKDAAPDRYAVDHSAGMYLLGPDGSFAKKFGYGTPVTEITTVIRELMEAEIAAKQTGRGAPEGAPR
jgi:protein SCO1/2